MSGGGDRAGALRSGKPGFWSRLTDTPLRDLARLRVTGRCDVAGVIRAGRLPEMLEALVRRVVRGTRLSRLEKGDVARELVAHFADGLEAGRTAEELMRSFGHERAAARMIGRAKRRNRSVVWQTWMWTRRAAGALVVVMLVGYGWLAYVYFTSKPVISHDYFADLNAKAASWKPEERAWPLYREAILAMRPWPSEFRGSCGEPMHCETHRAGMTAWLDGHHAALALARKASAKPGMGFLIAPSISTDDQALWPTTDGGESIGDALAGSLLMSLLPHLSECRSITRALSMQALRDIESDNADGAVANIVAIVHVASHVREIPALINDLVGMAQVSLACHTVNQVLSEHPSSLTDEQLRDLAHVLAGYGGGGGMGVSLDGERSLFLDVVQRVYSDDGRGGGRMIVAPQTLYELMGGEPETRGMVNQGAALGPLLMAVSADRADVLAKYDALLDSFLSAAALPLIERRAAVARIEARIEVDTDSVLDRNRYYLLYAIAPALGSALAAGDMAAMRRDAALAAIALELYRREHGSYPATLAELTPTYMPSLPEDRFVGRSMGYRLDEAGTPIIYSVGHNGLDDGGRLSTGFESPHAANDAASKWMASSSRSIPDGDWILHPPILPDPPRHHDVHEADGPLRDARDTSDLPAESAPPAVNSPAPLKR